MNCTYLMTHFIGSTYLAPIVPPEPFAIVPTAREHITIAMVNTDFNAANTVVTDAEKLLS
jgi:hypothetical protein